MNRWTNFFQEYQPIVTHNPDAGKNNGNCYYAPQVRELAEQLGIPYFVVKEKNSLPGIIAAQLQKNPKILVMPSGGDGTVCFVYQTIIEQRAEARTCVLPLAGGTLNELPKAEKLSTNPLTNLVNFSKLYQNRNNYPQSFYLREIFPISAVQGGKTYYGTYFLFGAPAEIIHHKYHANRTGWKAIKVIISALLAAFTTNDFSRKGFPKNYSQLYQKIPFQIKINGGDWRSDEMFAGGVMGEKCLANIKGYEFRPFSKNKADQQFYFTNINLVPRQIVWLVLKLVSELWKLPDEPAEKIELIFTGEPDSLIKINVNGDTHFFLANQPITIQKIVNPITILSQKK